MLLLFPDWEILREGAGEVFCCWREISKESRKDFLRDFLELDEILLGTTGGVFGDGEDEEGEFCSGCSSKNLSVARIGEGLVDGDGSLARGEFD